MKSRVRQGLLCTLVCLLVGCGVLELSARRMHHNATFQERLDTSIRWKPSGFVVCCPSPHQKIYELGERAADYAKVHYSFNRFGYRGKDFPVPKDPGEVRIVVFGGSHVFDQESYESRGDPGFPQLIEDRFRKSGRRVTVINAGLPGYDTRHFPSLLVLDIHRYSPDIVVVNSCWNDIKWISRTEADTLMHTTPPQAVKRNPMIEQVSVFDALLGSSSAYRKLRDAYWKRSLGIKSSADVAEGKVPDQVARPAAERGLSQYRMNLVAMVHLTRAIGACPILAVEERLVTASNNEQAKAKINWQFQPTIKTHQQLVEMYGKCDKVICQAGELLAVPVIDVNAKMSGDVQYFSDHVHTTVEGSRFIATRYYEILLPLVDRLLKE